MSERAATMTEQRIRGGLWGMLVGDALGVPYEFRPASGLPPLEELEMTPPQGFLPAHLVPPGTYSDDGAQALCLLASLLDRGRLDVADFAARLVAWWSDGYLAVDGDVFDVGVQTQLALRAIAGGAPPLEAASRDERANGNGSLMRVLPLALWHRGTDAELVRDAHLSSRPTHAHPRAEACCALYCLWARRELAGVGDPWPDAVQTLRDLYGDRDPHRDELEREIRPDAPPAGRGSGYVVDCLHSARLVCSSETGYEATVKRAIALGDDTDTTACVAGGIAGIRAGEAGIPARWRDALRGREHIAPLLDQLARMPSDEPASRDVYGAASTT